MKRRIIVPVVLVAVLTLAGSSLLGVGMLAGCDGGSSDGGSSDTEGVEGVFEEHESELRAIPGVLSLGTRIPTGEPPSIVVYVAEVTPDIRAAVPATLDGYRVDVEQEPAPPKAPPAIEGVVRTVKPAAGEGESQGLVGTLVVDGDFYAHGYGASEGEPLRLTVEVPASVQIWHPMGEGKEFIGFADIGAGDTVQLTLVEPVPAGNQPAVAADVEVYGGP